MNYVFWLLFYAAYFDDFLIFFICNALLPSALFTASWKAFAKLNEEVYGVVKKNTFKRRLLTVVLNDYKIVKEENEKEYVLYQFTVTDTVETWVCYMFVAV